jgi:O-antigen/teichoic acid export membrane protein
MTEDNTATVAAVQEKHLSGHGVVKNSMTTVITMVVTTGIALVSKAIMSRMIGPEGMGAYTLIVLVPSLAFVFGNLGINTSSIYFVGNRRFEIDLFAGTVLTSILVLSTIMMGILSAWAALSYHSIFQDVDGAYAVLAILSIPFFYLFNNFVSILQGENQIGQYNLISLASVLLFLFLLSVLLLVFHLELMGAVLAWFATTLFNAGFSVLQVSRFAKISLRFSKQVFHSQLVYGLKAYFANLAGFLVRRVDVLLVANFLGITQLGYYSIAFAIGELLWYFASSAGIALGPFVARSDQGDSKAVTTAVVRATLWGTAILCLLVPLGDRFAIRVVLGAAFLPAVAPLRWLLPGILLGAVEKVLAADLIGRGKPQVTMISAVLALAVNVAANLLLIPRFGISGASMASSLAYSAAALVTMILFLRLTGSGVSELLLLRRADVVYLARILQSGSKRFAEWHRD